MRLRYSLQLTISTLFISIISILGFILIYQGFSKTSEIMLNSAADLYGHISDELELDIRNTYDPVLGALQHLQSSPVIQADNFVQRKKELPVLKSMLVSAPSASSVGIAYADGDYFGAMLVNSEVMREKYQVPARAVIMLRYLNRSDSASGSKTGEAEPGFKSNFIYSIFYDDELNEISRNAGEASDFDPRLRPWYQSQEDEKVGKIIRTSPYVFYDSQVVGLTISGKASEDVVVAFDITLNDISKTIGKYRNTPSAQVVLIDEAGKTIAYDDREKLFISQQVSSDNTTLKLAPYTQLGSGVLSYIGERIQVKQQKLDFEYGSQRWIGSVRNVGKNGDLYVLMLTPVAELVKDALLIRNEQYSTALLILLLFIPVVWLTAKKISTPLYLLANEAEAISRFDFNVTAQKSSYIKEVNDLDTAMDMMRTTINKFITLIDSLAGEQDLNALIKNITCETKSISHSDAALIYLMDENDDLLKADFLCGNNNQSLPTEQFPDLSLAESKALFAEGDDSKSKVIKLDAAAKNKLTPLLQALGEDELSCIVLPLKNRNQDVVGMLCLIYRPDGRASEVSNIEFIEALSGFAAVTLESRQSLNMQEALLQSFIELIAGAIDAKSPYTSGHCERVPVITMKLAEAACRSQSEKFSDFDLDEKQWKELKTACWLHDCGKVTTPEYVVDKATKLETIYDRIHEVRTRFEVLKRDAEINCWKQIADGGDRSALLAQLEVEHKALDDDFAFIAECNIGGEFMSDDKIERLQSIAGKTWSRTMSDSLGISWEEQNRKGDTSEILPATEKVLSDKAEHLIARRESDRMPEDNEWGFKVDTPEYKYNRGELHNLCVQRGTLSEEERYMINGHMIETIKMLNKLPYPKSLRDVPLIAGSHHETMDGKGYPRRLQMSEQPLTSRMMVIADIFEALTASDRPYKKAKTLSESLRILSFMRNDKHIDADLFDLFLSSGVYMDYAKEFLKEEQVDDVNIEDYMS
ncbi:MAG: hypothetical protein IMF14_06315 [Proteobacteria bacterium]|nr:hypothetical protein [Pseudomonadota bacterium]